MTTDTRDTQKLVTTFLQSCQTKGLSNNTITIYSNRLTHFAQQCPYLPEDPLEIENWLITHGESFTKRGDILKRLQTFYGHLRQTNTIQTNPIPPGRPGRPRNLAQGQLPKHSHKQLKPSRTNTDTAHLVNEYLTSCDARGLSKRTLKEYRKQLNDFAKLYPTLTYNLPDIEKFWAGYGPEHDEWKHQLFTTVRTFYYWLADYKGLPTLLRFRRVTPKRSRKHPDNLSTEKAAQLLSLLPTMPEQDKAIIELLIEAGPRASELCSIVKEHIDDEGVLVKGKTGERIIEISPHVRDNLRNLIPGNSGPIFWSRTHQPLSTDAVYRMVSKYLAQIGITSGKRGPHMLRHTMGRLYMASEKGDLESLRQQMGHTNISTTGIYIELNRKQVHKKFEAANPRECIMQLIRSNGYVKPPEQSVKYTLACRECPNKLYCQNIMIRA